MSWKQVSEDRSPKRPGYWKVIEAKMISDYKKNIRMVILSEELFGGFSSLGVFLRWSIIFVVLGGTRTGSWIWASGKWNRICKAYQFINRSSAYYK